MFVIQKLREDNKLLPEELVGKVHGGVDDPGAVSPDGVSDVSDADGVQVFAVACLLNENLRQEKH